MIEKLSALLQPRGVDASKTAQRQPAPKTSGQTETVKLDVLDLSAAAKELGGLFDSDKLRSLLQDIPKGKDGQPIQLQEMQKRYHELLGQFQSRLAQIMSDNGINTDGSLRLRSGAEGQLVVEGSHDDINRIQQLLQNEPDFGGQFRQLAAMGGVLNAASKASEFRKAYVEDPQAAIRKHFEEMGLDRNGFKMELTPTDVEIDLG